jgi:ATP-dependent protease ClpP protease subunit
MKAIIPIVGEINEKTVDKYLSIVNNTENLSELHFKIDSQGGFVQAADNIISHAKSLGVKITTEQVGKVMSAASKLMAIGDDRIGNKGDDENIMIHLPRIQAPKNLVITSEVAKKLDTMLTVIEDQFIDTYSNVITLGKEKIKRLMSKETFMTNKEALDIGLLTKINAKSLGSKIETFTPVAYIDESELKSLIKTDNIMIDEKVESGIVDKVLAALEKREEAKKAKTELSEVKASNEDLTKQLEDAKSVKAEADKKVEELETALKAEKAEKETILLDAASLAKATNEIMEELKSFKSKEVSPATEEEAVKAENPTKDEPVAYQPMSREVHLPS